MASRLVDDTLVTPRPRRTPMPTLSRVSRSVARLTLMVLVLCGLFLFLYLMEVSQTTTTAFDIEVLQRQHQQWVERNKALEAQLAELESPSNVMKYAEAHGMTPRTEAEYILIQQIEPTP